MKKTLLFLISLTFVLSNINAQDTLAAWFFYGSSADAVVDIHSPENAGLILQTENPQRAITFTVAGIDGGDDKCAQTVGWDNGNDTKYWYIEFMPTGYKNIKISSVQSSCNMHHGPKNFKIQYRTDCCDTNWHDLQNANITDTADWIKGKINNASLPEECDDEDMPIKLRWVMTSNLNIKDMAVMAMGMSRIDNIT